jgi:site-specific recombinase XerC
MPRFQQPLLNCRTLLESWSKAAVEELNPASLRRYRGCLLAFLNWFEQVQLRPLTPADLNSTTLAGYRASLQKTATTATVNIHLCALRSWCAYLVEQNYLSSNPARRLKLVGQPIPLAPKALEPGQLNALLRQTTHTRYPARNAAIIQMLVQTGLRIGECASLHFEDITFGERQGEVMVKAGKGNKSRRVPLNASLRQALADYLAPRLEVNPTIKAVAAAWPTSEPGQNPLDMWLSERGNSLSLREMNRTIQRLLQQCANQQLFPTGFTAHSLRHTFATAYLKGHPYDLVGLGRLLGHSSLNTTRIYVEPTASELAGRVETIELNIYGN